jgi:hypothetical protein
MNHDRTPIICNRKSDSTAQERSLNPRGRKARRGRTEHLVSGVEALGIYLNGEMNVNLHERFQQFEDEFLKFGRVETKRSNRRDLHAFMLLDELLPGARPMIAASEHDEFYLDIDCGKLAEVVTDEQIKELHRCGVRHDKGYDCLCMFA